MAPLGERNLYGPKQLTVTDESECTGDNMAERLHTHTYIKKENGIKRNAFRLTLKKMLA